MGNMQLVAFRIGREEYAIPIEQVREIINYMPVTRLPETPTYFEGVINVRGKIVPVVDFAAKLGLVNDSASKQIVIVETSDKEVGLTVDLVTEVIQTVNENFSDIESIDGSEQKVRTVYKLSDRIIILLDLEQLLAGAEAA